MKIEEIHTGDVIIASSGQKYIVTAVNNENILADVFLSESLDGAYYASASFGQRALDNFTCPMQD